ncbi:rab-GTPase-TBC domain-containing protein [Myxozyma melibiosi]|uniref:Rab-GTPase-TBC domain-containing protein n=1 Tax=Myxozyma melibiosi TaxID=54550 RepID=A0ABR1F9N9_9ASCO
MEFSQRSVDQTRLRWKKLFDNKAYPSLTALKSSVIGGSSICEDSLRSVCWKLFMLMPDLQPDTWGTILQTEREKYTALKRKYLALHLKRAQETAGSAVEEEEEVEDINVVNPLSVDESNPWKTFWKDEDLRKEILQDIERTFPDFDYFRDPKVQNTMLDILFVYTKMNPVVSYQQGMHELLAPIFYVMSLDALDTPAETPSEEDKLMYDTLSSSYIEHDSFTLFNLIMQNAWEWYAAVGKTKGVTENGRQIPPIVTKARKIQEQFLRKIDPELERHLRNLDIEPQMWGIRWIRLLFGREFGFVQMLGLWDCLFAADGRTLDIVDFICVAMLLRVRNQLLLTDYTGVLSTLLRYPVDETMTSNSFVEDAIYLQAHCTAAGGRRVMQQYALLVEEEEVVVPQQPYHMVNGVLAPSPSASEYQRRAMVAANSMEQRVQGLAKNVFESSEKWTGDINKYVRQRVQDARVRAEKAIQNGGVHYLTAENAGIRGMPYMAQNITYVNGNGSGAIPRSRSSLAAAQAVVKQKAPVRPGAAMAGGSFDEAEYNRERNEALAAVLSTSLEVLEKSNGSSENAAQFKEALARIEHVRKCLLFDDLKISKKYKQPITDALFSQSVSNGEKSIQAAAPTALSTTSNQRVGGSEKISTAQAPIPSPVAVPAAQPRAGMPRAIRTPPVSAMNSGAVIRGRRSAASSPVIRATSNSPDVSSSLSDPLADYSLDSAASSPGSTTKYESSVQARPVSSEFARYNNGLKEQKQQEQPQNHISQAAIESAKAMLFGSLEDKASSSPSSTYSPSSSPATASPSPSLSSSVTTSAVFHSDPVSQEFTKLSLGATDPLFKSPPPKSTNTAILSSTSGSGIMKSSPGSPSITAEEAKKLLLGL